jgi:hypothetical protein
VRDLGALWHLLGGAAVMSVLCVSVHFACWPWWVSLPMVPLLGLGGYARERYQHDWEPLNAHRWIEALAWPAGAAAVGLGQLLLLS